MKRTPLIASLTTVALLGLAGCGGGDEALESDSSGDSGDSGSSSGEVVVGSANFPENALLAEIYAGALNGAGVEASTRLNIGSREVYIPAIEDASIDILPEYTGVLRDYFLAEEDAGARRRGLRPRGRVRRAARRPCPRSSRSPWTTPRREDKDAVVVTSETAEEYDLTEIGDLADVAGDLTLGGAPEWKTRQTGLPGPRGGLRRGVRRLHRARRRRPAEPRRPAQRPGRRREPLHHRPEHRRRGPRRRSRTPTRCSPPRTSCRCCAATSSTTP